MQTETKQTRQSRQLRHWYGFGIVALVALLAGCQQRGPRPADIAPVSTNDMVVAPARFYVNPAPITTVNLQFKFVVLDFSSRLMPPVGTRLSVYRGDERVGLVQITEPVRQRFATADIVSGDLQAGDEAR